MGNKFYAVVYRTRDGRYDVMPRSTKRGAYYMMNMLKQAENVVKVGILPKKAWTYLEIITRLQAQEW